MIMCSLIRRRPAIRCACWSFPPPGPAFSKPAPGDVACLGPLSGFKAQRGALLKPHVRALSEPAATAHGSGRAARPSGVDRGRANQRRVMGSRDYQSAIGHQRRVPGDRSETPGRGGGAPRRGGAASMPPALKQLPGRTSHYIRDIVGLDDAAEVSVHRARGVPLLMR